VLRCSSDSGCRSQAGNATCRRSLGLGPEASPTERNQPFCFMKPGVSSRHRGNGFSSRGLRDPCAEYLVERGKHVEMSIHLGFKIARYSYGSVADSSGSEAANVSTPQTLIKSGQQLRVTTNGVGNPATILVHGFLAKDK